MYGMRHTFASNLLIAGVSDVKVARWLGHRDTRMLHKHYGHLLSYDADINSANVARDDNDRSFCVRLCVQESRMAIRDDH